MMDRRTFLGASAALLATRAAGRADKSPNEKLHVGVVGVANRGAANLGGVAGAGAEVVALCDADERLAGRARSQFPKARFFADFRKMIDAGKLDAVVVSTPDHTHALPTVTALRAGLHVYCEKPLTHTVREAQIVAAEAKKAKRVTQLGTQIHAGENYRRVVELIRAGTIGPVKEVHVWCGKSWGGGTVPGEGQPVPKGLHYDLWLGPAKYRPYHKIYLPANWRRFWAFGGGTLADMACHHMDLPFWALDLKRPTRVSADGPKPDPEVAPRWVVAKYEFPARGGMPPVSLTWYDGGKRPAVLKKLPRWGDGSLFVGEKGLLLADYGRHLLWPKEKFADFKRPEPSIPRSVGHHREWVRACKTGGPTTCDFAYSGLLTEAVLLGTAAHRAGNVSFQWDGKKTDGDVANRFLRRDERDGWGLT